MILVTGGTGLVGSHLLYKLAADTEKIRATMRPSSDTAQVRKVFGYYSENTEADKLFENIEWVTADINDIPSLSIAFEDITQVYHCAALISFDPSDEKKMRKINIEGTANIVNLCITNNISKLCYVKIGSFYGKKRQITRDSINGLYEETYFDNSKLKSKLNFEYTSMDRVFADTSEVYKKEDFT